MSSSSSNRSSSGTPPTELDLNVTFESLPAATPLPDASVVRPKKRKGKRITLLREAYAVDQPTNPTLSDQVQNELVRYTKLSPSSTEVKSLAGLELRAALTYDLIRQAWVTLDVLHAPGWKKVDRTPVRQKFSARSLESDVVTAALLAVGAMTSTHSAIVGQVKRIDHPSPDDLVALGLGRRREAAVKVLAARSVAIARESGVLESPDPFANEVSSLLRMVMLFSARDNPFMIELRDNLRFRQAFQPPETTKRAVNSLIASDAFVGLMFNKKLEVTDEELLRFGVKDVQAQEARKRLETIRATNAPVNDETTLHDLRHCGMALMRDVVRIQTSPLDEDAPSILAKFSALYEVLDLLLDLLCQIPKPAERQSFRYHLLLKMPIILESTLTNQATRHAKARRDNLCAQELLLKAQRRFLNSLARSSHTLDLVKMGAEQVTATVWNALDVFPDWDELAIEGAKQNGRGEGPLSNTAWTWEEFARMHDFLKVSTATFATSDAREKRFRKAWDARQSELMEIEQRNVLARLASFAVGAKAQVSIEQPADGALAERMVNRALVELTA